MVLMVRFTLVLNLILFEIFHISLKIRVCLTHVSFARYSVSRTHVALQMLSYDLCALKPTCSHENTSLKRTLGHSVLYMYHIPAL